MFSSARQGNLFYILNKGEKPTVKIGQVVSVSTPQPKFPTQFNAMQPFQQTEMLVDVQVKCGDETIDFQKLPANGEVFAYNNAIVSDKKEAILSEIEGMLQSSKQIIESVPYHQSVMENCNSILRELNPQFAKEKQQEEEIGALKSEVKSLKGDLGDIKDILLKMSSGASSKQAKS